MVRQRGHSRSYNYDVFSRNYLHTCQLANQVSKENKMLGNTHTLKSVCEPTRRKQHGTIAKTGNIMTRIADLLGPGSEF